MAKVFLFQEGDMLAPAWTEAQLQAAGLWPINIYSSSDSEIWGGTGSFGSQIDILIGGYGLLGPNPRVNDFAGYAFGSPYISIKDFDVAGASFTSSNFLPGLLVGNDEISGSPGNDTLVGFRGWDYIWGNTGDDIIYAGNGRDRLWGSSGSDILSGDFGLNTYEWEKDGYIDTIIIKSDQLSYNWLYGKAGNNPNGEKADKIIALDSYDKIFVSGAATSSLSFRYTDHASALGETLSGVGIYADGFLEAVYIGGDLSVAQIQSMTRGLTG